MEEKIIKKFLKGLISSDSTLVSTKKCVGMLCILVYLTMCIINKPITDIVMWIGASLVSGDSILNVFKK